MNFDGVVETLSQERVTGWAVCDAPEGRIAPKLTLQFNTLGSLAVTKNVERQGGLTGFVFELPSQFQHLSWAEFLSEFQAVYAEYEANDGIQYRHIVPLYKSVMAGLDPTNRTGLLTDRLKQYKLGPQPNGRIAAFTIAYNEYQMLALWARYYSQQFGAENLFVIDQGSDRPYDDILPKGVSIIRVPRDQFDNYLIWRLNAILQRFLLESYDSVLYTDSDEFVCASPEVLGGRSLRQFLLEIPEPVGITTGYNLYHDLHNEGPYDPSRPLLEQRRVIKAEPSMCKPLIARTPLNWTPGGHTARERGVPIKGLYMLHLRWFDLDAALRKGGIYRASAWDAFDIERKLGDYQRWEESDIGDRFRAWSDIGARVRDSSFDGSAEWTVVPDWMRKTIQI